MEWLYLKKLNLKNILLDSLDSQKVVTGCKMMSFNKRCYKVHYKIEGKYMSFLNIKRVFKKSSMAKRVKKRLTTLENYAKERNVRLCSKAVQTVKPFAPKYENFSVQTDAVKTESSSTQTAAPGILCLNKSIQTEKEEKKMKPQKRFIHQDTQTVVKIKNRGVQTDSIKTSNSKTQVSPHVASSGAQIEIENSTQQTQTEIRTADLDFEFGRAEILNDAMVFLLTDLGEQVLDHRNILNNNSQMLDEILEHVRRARSLQVQSSSTTFYANSSSLALRQQSSTNWYSSMRINNHSSNTYSTTSNSRVVQTNTGIEYPEIVPFVPDQRVRHSPINQVPKSSSSETQRVEKCEVASQTDRTKQDMATQTTPKRPQGKIRRLTRCWF